MLCLPQEGQRSKLGVCENQSQVEKWARSDFHTLLYAKICEPLTSHPLVNGQKTYPHLTGLELADDPGDDQSFRVDILIGSDHY